MRILISGCSYSSESHDTPDDQKTWPSRLKSLNPKLEIDNLSFYGAGNHYIHDSIFYKLLHNRYDLVLVMWSGLLRQEIIISKLIWYKNLQPSLSKLYPFYREVGDLVYVFSGGIAGTWLYSDSTIRDLFKLKYKYSDYISLSIESLLKIVSLQAILKQRSQPYRFMSYANYWIRTTQNFHKVENGIPLIGTIDSPIVSDVSQLRSIMNLIDFNNWIWAGDNKKCLYDLMKDFPDDQATYDKGGHPTAMVQNYFCDNFINPMIQC